MSNVINYFKNVMSNSMIITTVRRLYVTFGKVVLAHRI